MCDGGDVREVVVVVCACVCVCKGSGGWRGSVCVHSINSATEAPHTHTHTQQEFGVTMKQFPI